MSAFQAAGLWTGLLILVLVALSIRVMRARWRHRVPLGDGAEGQLSAPSRAFGNAAEHTPLMIGALILLAQLGEGTLVIHILGAAFLIGRLVHPVGLALKAPNLPRAVGMILTWLPLIAAAVLLLMAAFGIS